MRAIAFLIAAFAILAACNRPVTAERAAKASAMSPQVKQEAERVRAVDSREDRPPGEPRVADRTLAEKVRQALIEERGLTAHELDVRARDGVVTLSGKIEERSDQDRMMLVARSIEGVRSVVSRLVLERPA